MHQISTKIHKRRVHLKSVTPNTQIIHGFNGLLYIHVFKEMNN